MAQISVIAGLLLVLFAVAARAGLIPSYIQVCKRNDPQLDKCILNSVEKLRPKLVRGIKELDVPPLEPLVLPVVNVDPGSQVGNIHAIGRNVRVYGPGQFKVTKLKTDLAKNVFDISLFVPSLYFEADYEVNARILSFPVKGKGKMTANTTECNGDIVMKAQLVKRNNGTFLYFYNMDVKVDVKKVSVHLDGLFNNDRTLGEATNRVLNENAKDVWPVIRPFAEKTIAEVLLDISNKVTLHFPYEDLFPLK